jgi:CPA1 family monovalent cation:H+ antiporter
LDALAGEDWVRDETAERLRGLYGFRVNRFSSRFDDAADGGIEEQSQAYQRLRRELLDAERDAVTQLGRSGEISGEVVNRVRRDLDLEDARLDV